jgi:hypothetical protein
MLLQSTTLILVLILMLAHVIPCTVNSDNLVYNLNPSYLIPNMPVKVLASYSTAFVVQVYTSYTLNMGEFGPERMRL